MPAKRKYMTRIQRPPLKVKINPLAREEVRRANQQFQEGMRAYFEEVDRKLIGSRQNATRICQ